MNETLKQKMYLLLEDQKGLDPRARLVRAFLVILILLNVLAAIMETMEEISAIYRHIFRVFEYFSVAIFTVEYAARMWVCDEGMGNAGIIGRIKHALRPLMLVDLLAILPFYLPFLLPADLIFLRAIRLMRLLRVLKLGRYSDAIHVFFSVIRLKKEQLAVAGFGLGILLIIAASMMYYFEHLVQPAIFGSIPHSMWWAIITLTTVGYGDAYPVTAMGRVLASIIALLGIGMFALPAGILSAGFVEYGEKKKKNGTSCPHCGAPLAAPDDPDESSHS
ncbi:MAG: ion transporter [Pseudodesulfovibrio sp.]|nr:ion transporter [Pseudodesulfovibrio sp.]